MRVAIIHPWMPEYRIGFFVNLKSRLLELGIELDVFFGEPESDWKLRNDQSELDFGKMLPTKQIRFLGRTLLSKDISKIDGIENYGLVIVEHAVRNLETYKLLFRGIPLAFWGHGRTYTQRALPILESLKTLLAKKGSWFFAYTAGGADYLARKGYASDQITVLNNTIDTTELAEQLSRVTDEEVVKLRRQVLGEATDVALYLGALDKSKRLDFLIQALDQVAASKPGFRLVVVGDGPERHKVELASSTRPWMYVAGSKLGAEKALYLRAADVLTIPGRAGLVVIDSFCAQVPIVTTTDPYHPPEFEYLIAGRNALIADLVAADYSKAVLKGLDSAFAKALKNGCSESAEKYSIDDFVENFSQGILNFFKRSEKKTTN